MPCIPQARKEAILNKMMSPHPLTISALSKQEGISEQTLYNWRKQLRQEGRPVPEHDRTSDNWSGQVDSISTWEPMLTSAHNALAENASELRTEGGFLFDFNLAGLRNWTQANPEILQKLL